jgi:hypothetical protein
MTRHFDTIVAGGGLVGLAIAYGLVREGLRVAVCDEDDRAFRASRGNFGLVWVQGKGADLPAYAQLTMQSAQRWPGFAARLKSETGIDPALSQPGGFSLYLDAGELADRAALMARIAAHTPEFRYETLDADGARRLVPGLGPDVAGAIHSPQDGHVNPLKTLHALLTAFEARGGVYLPFHRIDDIVHGNSAFERLPADAVKTLTIDVDGRMLSVDARWTVAAALVAHGYARCRRNDAGESRGAFCFSGVCFECLVEIDGVPRRQACLTPVAQGMKVVLGCPEALP